MGLIRILGNDDVTSLLLTKEGASSKKCIFGIGSLEKSSLTKILI